MPPKPRHGAPSLREAVADRNTSDADVQQQLLSKSAGRHSLPNVPLPDVPLPDLLLPNVPLPELRPDHSVGDE